MSLNDRFIATTVSWFRDRPEEVTRVVEQSFTDPNQGAHVEWRNSPIEDYRRRIVPAGAERLIRWDQRSPNEIFRDGFSPRVIPREGQIPRDAANLSPYVRDYARHPNSIFVSAARYYRNRRGNVARWAPRNRTGIYEDEVFAHGGIDVNLSIGDHRDFSQHEIAFSGGIRGEFIRSARHHDSSGSPHDLALNSLVQSLCESQFLDKPAGHGRRSSSDCHASARSDSHLDTVSPILPDVPERNGGDRDAVGEPYRECGPRR